MRNVSIHDVPPNTGEGPYPLPQGAYLSPSFVGDSMRTTSFCLSLDSKPWGRNRRVKRRGVLSVRAAHVIREKSALLDRTCQALRETALRETALRETALRET